jgi:hypothetical protein
MVFHIILHLSKKKLSIVNTKTLSQSGKIGHGLGIVGTSMVIIGMVSYSSRKRLRLLSMAGNIRDWLNFHIFLCLAGPVLILFHIISLGNRQNLIITQLISN